MFYYNFSVIHFACDGSGTAYDLAIADLGLHANLRFGGHGVISRIESFYWLLRRRVKCGVARGTGQFRRVIGFSCDG